MEQLTEYEQKSRDNVTQAISTILDELNGGNRKKIASAIYDRLSREHRTLQQAFWSAMLLAQIQYADNRHDLRNEDAVKLAKLVKDLAVRNNMDMGLAFI